MCPQNFKEGGKQLTLTIRLRVGPETLANPQPTRVSKGGSRGAQAPLAGAVGGVPPQIQKRGRVAPISKPTHEWDPTRQQTQSPRGWAAGVEGAQPLPRGFGGMCPQKPKEGASCSH